MMSLIFIAARWVKHLVAIDERIALAVKGSGCPHCGGPLDAGHYLRKAFGSEKGECTLRMRWSWCCRRKGCRRRLTPPSVLFWGCHRYVGPLVLAMMGEDRNSASGKEMRRGIECSHSTWRRWRERWTRLWEGSTGRLLAGVTMLSEAGRRSVSTVLSQWEGGWPHQAAMLLLAIHPLTGGPSWERAHQPHASLDPQTMGFAKALAGLKDVPRSF